MPIKQILNRIKTLLTQKLSQRALIFFAVVFFIGFLVIGVTATEGIGSLVEVYRLRKERISNAGLPRASDVKKETIFEKVGKVFGILPQSGTVQISNTNQDEPPGEVELTPEEERMLVQIPGDLASAEESIKKIADLISEAILDIINEADETPLTTFIVNKIFTDYPEISKVITVADAQNALAPKITDAFQNQDFKDFLDNELQALIKERAPDLIGSNPSPEELERAVNNNLGNILVENLPIIFKKAAALNILTNNAYDGLNGISVFDTTLTARTVSNQTGNMTYNFDCHNDGSVEKTDGPTSATSDSVSSVCYYFRSGTASVNMSKESIGSASSTATISVSGNTISITPVNQAPIIDIGSSQTVQEGSAVTLNGSRSIDPEGGTLSYTWTQTSGTAVSFSATSSSPSFTAPTLGQNEEEEDILSETLSFQLTVQDNQGASASGSISVTVIKDVPEAQTDNPVLYLAASLSGSSLGKINYLNRVMNGALRQYTEDQIKNYFNNNFTNDTFGAFINSNIREMTVDITKSTFRSQFITENADGTPVPEEIRVSRGIYRESRSGEGGFDMHLVGRLFQTIQGYGSCRKSWHYVTRCNCRCQGQAYLWDPITRKCGCER